jgi:predicted RND superfamily exporter protein
MNNDRINKWAEEFGMSVIMKYRFLFLAGIVLLVVLSLLGTKRLVTDSSNESFLPKGDEMIVQNDRFKEIFGNEEFVFVFVEADNVFDHDTLEYVRALSEDFDRNLPFAREVTSLTSIEYMDAYDDILEVEDLIGDEIPADRESLEEISAFVKDVR